MIEDFDIEGIVDRMETDGLSLDSVVGEMDQVYRNGLPPVPIERFLSDDYYMGKVAKDLYPENLPDMLDIFSPQNNYIEIILTGATSIGKTFMAAMAMTYVVYTMGCFNNPHHWLGGSEASPIVIINMSVNAQKAREVIFTRVKTMVDMSPYFREKFPRDLRLVDSLVWRTSHDAADLKARTGAQILFKPGTGDSLSALGDDIYAGIGDELNFFRVIEKSKRSFGEAFDPAQRLYDVIGRRMKGRFSAGGLALGKFFLLSSAQYPDDFIERRIEEAEADGSLGKTVKVIRKSIWEAKRGVMIHGTPVYCGKTFRVEVGTSRRGSRLLESWDKRSGELTEKGFTDVEGKVLNVPTELWDDFYRDIEGSVRDFGGEVTRAISPFFADTDVIYDAISPDLNHPWTREETTLLDGSHMEVSQLFIKDEKTDRLVPRRNPGKRRYIHVDLAETGDSAGLAVVHISGWKTIMESGKQFDEAVYETDLVLRINPPVGGSIDFSKIRNIIYELRNHGMSVSDVTYDSYQSTDSIQELNSRGYNAYKLSVDRDMSQYAYLKNCFYDKRIVLYHYEKLEQELSRLEKKLDKVDHPANGSKDVADALCGAVWTAFTAEGGMSARQMESRLPQAVKKPDLMANPQAREMARVARESEEDLRTMMGGSKIVRK